MRNVSVGDIMTRSFVSVRPTESLFNCIKTMVKHRVGSVLITEDSKLLGILTERDLFKSILKKSNLTKTRAIDIAVKKVAVIKPSATLAQAFQKMREKFPNKRRDFLFKRFLFLDLHHF
jgi:CBS domain-containing protein